MNSSNHDYYYPSIDNEAYNLFDIPNFTGSPERRLLLAILERALLDYVGNDEKEYQEANDWIFNDQPTPYPSNRSEFSFSWVCEELDLNVDDIRGKIKQMPRRGESRIAPWYLTKNYNDKDKKPAEKKQKGKVIKFDYFSKN